MKRITLIYFLWVICTSAFAISDEGKELRQIMDKFRNQRAYYEVEYRVTDQNDPGKKLIESSKINCYNWYPYSLYQMDGADIYHNDKIKLAVYHKNKLMVLNKADHKADNMLLKMNFSLDSILKFYQKIEPILSEVDKRTIRIYYKPSFEKYKYTDITFNPQTFQLEKIAIYYKKNIQEIFGKSMYKEDKQKILPQVDIVFSSYKELKKEDWNIFTAEKFLHVDNNGKVTLKPPYTKYVVSNYYKLK